MNDFVALLVSTIVFSLAFLAFGLATRVLLAHHLGPLGLGEGNALQYGSSLAIAALAYRLARGAPRRAA